MKQHHPLPGRAEHARRSFYALSLVLPSVWALFGMMPGCGGKLGVVPEATGGTVNGNAGEPGERGGSGGASMGRGPQSTGGMSEAGRFGMGAPGGPTGASGEGADGETQTCAGAADCTNGEVCCAAFGGSDGPPTLQTACSSRCDTGSGTIEVCNSSDECPDGSSCEPGPSGINVCVDASAAGAGGRMGFGGNPAFGGQPAGGRTGAGGRLGSGGRRGAGGRSGRAGP
jgi:hypothetical protein